MKELTKKQRRVLDYIKKEIFMNGLPPTRRNIAAHMKVTVGMAQQYVLVLEKKGYVQRVPKDRRRSIRVLKE